MSSTDFKISGIAGTKFKELSRRSTRPDEGSSQIECPLVMHKGPRCWLESHTGACQDHVIFFWRPMTKGPPRSIISRRQLTSSAPRRMSINSKVQHMHILYFRNGSSWVIDASRDAQMLRVVFPSNRRRGISAPPQLLHG